MHIVHERPQIETLPDQTEAITIIILFSRFNPCAAELFVFIFHQLKLELLAQFQLQLMKNNFYSIKKRYLRD